MPGFYYRHSKHDLPETELLVGCYPCTRFSNAAWRRWSECDKRDLLANPDNFLLLEFIKAIPSVNPKFVFIENVKGLKASAKGYFFKAQREALEASGYTVYSTHLDAKDYGLPQSLETYLYHRGTQ